MRDKTLAIQFAKDLKFHLKSKQINRHYHFMQDIIKTKEIVIKYITSNKMVATLLTKLIPRDTFDAYKLNLKLRKI